MKKSVITMVILFGILVIVWMGNEITSAEEAGEKEKNVNNSVKVMTFNMRFENDSDHSPHTWDERRERVQALIQEEQPDIIGTQEGLYDQVFDINQDLADYQWIGLGRDGGSHGEYVAIYYKDKLYTPIEYDHFWLSDTPEVIGSKTWGNSITRMVTWVKFEENSSGEQFYFVNTHFDHQSDNAREESAKLINDRITNTFEDLPIILTGDFNANQDSKHYQILTNEGMFKDTWETAQDKVNEQLGTFNGFNDPTGGGINNKIDWILTKGMKTKSVKVNDYRNDDGQFASDHYPVVAELDFMNNENKEVLSRMLGRDNDGMSGEAGINGPMRITGDAVVNTFDGAWIAYENLDFSDVEINSLTVNYAVNQNRSASDGKLLVYADAMDEAHLITEMELEPTSESSWDEYVSKRVEIEDASLLDGVHDIYIQMTGSTSESHPYILNFKYLQFEE